MKREELIQALAARMDVSPTSAQVFLHACFDIVKSRLQAGEEVTLPNIGTWTPTNESGGKLASVRYAAFVPVNAEVPESEAFPTDLMDGPASSIDTRHFIPASALNGKELKLPAIIDVATLVAEVRASFAPASPDADSVVESDSLSDTPTIENTDLVGEADTIEAAVRADEVDIADDPEWVEEAELVEEAEPLADGAVEVDNTVEINRPEEADFLSEEDLLLEAEMEAEGYESLEAQTDQAVIEEDDSINEGEDSVSAEQQDPLSDDEVFNRNRDQLYHPPKEPSNRPLVITAAALTFCVLVIIIYLLLDRNEPRELPGSEAIGCLVVVPGRSSSGNLLLSPENMNNTFSLYRSIR